jgi:hypothetical protein
VTTLLTNVQTQVTDVLKTTESYVVDAVEKANKPVQDAVSNLPFGDQLENLPSLTDLLHTSFELARKAVDFGFGFAATVTPGADEAPAKPAPAPKATKATASV